MLIEKLFQTWFLVNATYNSFRHQVGYCKMQGYKTVSRNTSMGPSLFTSGDVLFGVGLSNNQFDGRYCGMCLQISHGENIRKPTNSSLVDFSSHTIDHSFIVMVFDQCTDPVCVNATSFLDFDVYSHKPPTSRGNPHHVKWKAVECPVGGNHFNVPLKHYIEYLICTPKSCNKHDTLYKNKKRLAELWNPNYFSFTVRNSRVPISSMQLNEEPLLYVDGFGWTFSGIYPENKTFVLELQAFDGTRLLDVFDYDQIMNLSPLEDYNGGALLKSVHQI